MSHEMSQFLELKVAEVQKKRGKILSASGGTSGLRLYTAKTVADEASKRFSKDELIKFLLSKFSIPGSLTEVEQFQDTIILNLVTCYFVDFDSAFFPLAFSHFCKELEDSESELLKNYTQISSYFVNEFPISLNSCINDLGAIPKEQEQAVRHIAKVYKRGCEGVFKKTVALLAITGNSKRKKKTSFSAAFNSHSIRDNINIIHSFSPKLARKIESLYDSNIRNAESHEGIDLYYAPTIIFRSAKNKSEYTQELLLKMANALPVFSEQLSVAFSLATLTKAALENIITQMKGSDVSDQVLKNSFAQEMSDLDEKNMKKLGVFEIPSYETLKNHLKMSNFEFTSHISKLSTFWLKCDEQIELYNLSQKLIVKSDVLKIPETPVAALGVDSTFRLFANMTYSERCRFSELSSKSFGNFLRNEHRPPKLGLFKWITTAMVSFLFSPINFIRVMVLFSLLKVSRRKELILNNQIYELQAAISNVINRVPNYFKCRSLQFYFTNNMQNTWDAYQELLLELNSKNRTE